MSRMGRKFYLLLVLSGCNEDYAREVGMSGYYWAGLANVSAMYGEEYRALLYGMKRVGR